jgi:hypothetical protein
MTPEVLLPRTQDPCWFRCCDGQIQCLIYFKEFFQYYPLDLGVGFPGSVFHVAVDNVL